MGYLVVSTEEKRLKHSTNSVAPHVLCVLPSLAWLSVRVVIGVLSNLLLECSIVLE